MNLHIDVNEQWNDAPVTIHEGGTQTGADRPPLPLPAKPGRPRRQRRAGAPAQPAAARGGRPDADRRSAADLGGDRLQPLDRFDARRARRDRSTSRMVRRGRSTTRACWPTGTTRTSPTSRPTFRIALYPRDSIDNGTFIFRKAFAGGRAGVELHGGLGYDNIQNQLLAQAGGAIVVASSWSTRLTVSYDYIHQSATSGFRARSRSGGSPSMQISSRRLLVEAGVGTAIVLGAVAVAVPAPHLGWGHAAPAPGLAGGAGARRRATARAGWWSRAGRLGRAGAASAAPWRAAPSQALAALATPAELGALAAAIVVSWIASVHERRTHDPGGEAASAGRGGPATTRRRSGELRRAALALRARNDRLDLALTFLRDVARRIDGGDVTAAVRGGAGAGGRAARRARRGRRGAHRRRPADRPRRHRRLGRRPAAPGGSTRPSAEALRSGAAGARRRSAGRGSGRQRSGGAHRRRARDRRRADGARGGARRAPPRSAI